MYDNTHFTDEYHNELMYYYDDFFSLFYLNKMLNIYIYIYIYI